MLESLFFFLLTTNVCKTTPEKFVKMAAKIYMFTYFYSRRYIGYIVYLCTVYSVKQSQHLDDLL